jgi:hypothetical protein
MDGRETGRNGDLKGVDLEGMGNEWDGIWKGVEVEGIRTGREGNWLPGGCCGINEATRMKLNCSKCNTAFCITLCFFIYIEAAYDHFGSSPV